MPFWLVVDEIWNNHLHIALDAVADHLNPRIFYSSDYYFDKEVFEGVNCCIECMVPNGRVQSEIWPQLDHYFYFGMGRAIDRRNDIHPDGVHSGDMTGSTARHISL